MNCKKLCINRILLLVFLITASAISFGQCNWTSVDFEGFEYTEESPDLIEPYLIFHPNPSTYNNLQHSGATYLYMNFIDNLAPGSLVYERFYDVCIGQEYQISNWFQGANNSFSNITFNIVDANGVILDTWSGASIPGVWTNFISNPVIATTNSISFQLISDFAPGNNDMAFDDLELLQCINPPFDDGQVGACGNTPIDLYNSIVSVSGTTGTWTGPSVLGNGHLGTFTPGLSISGMYTYTISNIAPCPDEVVSLTVNVFTQPNIDDLLDAEACNEFVLPAITGTNLSGNESYYSGPNATGIAYDAGDIISTSGDIFIFDGQAPCTDEQSFNLTIYNAEADLGPDLELCEGEVAMLDATHPDATYLWQDNSTSSSIEIIAPGIYYVTTTVGICSDQDSVIVNYNPLPTVNLGEDMSICEDEILTLDANNTGASFFWQNGAQAATFDVSEAGQYYVDVIFDLTSCQNSDTINVSEILLPQLDFGNDTMVCQNEVFQLNPEFAFADSIVWFNGNTEDSYRPIAPSTYHATVFNECGIAYDEIELEFIDCSCNIYIPNAISANGDGINETFKPVIDNCDFYNYEFTLMDRWGQIVFSTNEPEEEWDGSVFSSEPYYSEGGIYAWVMTFEAVVNGNITSEKRTGHVSLLR
ncbi:MAG: gliding motility-associated C-terminal domain-containing protein [Bacteroidota bacterium]